MFWKVMILNGAINVSSTSIVMMTMIWDAPNVFLHSVLKCSRIFWNIQVNTRKYSRKRRQALSHTHKYSKLSFATYCNYLKIYLCTYIGTLDLANIHK